MGSRRRPHGLPPPESWNVCRRRGWRASVAMSQIRDVVAPGVGEVEATAGRVHDAPARKGRVRVGHAADHRELAGSGEVEGRDAVVVGNAGVKDQLGGRGREPGGPDRLRTVTVEQGARQRNRRPRREGEVAAGRQLKSAKHPALLRAEQEPAARGDEGLRGRRAHGERVRRARGLERPVGLYRERRVVWGHVLEVPDAVGRLVRHDEDVAAHADGGGGDPTARERRAGHRRQRPVVGDVERRDRVRALIDREEQRPAGIHHELLVRVEDACVVEVGRARAPRRVPRDERRGERPAAVLEDQDRVLAGGGLVPLDVDDAIERPRTAVEARAAGAGRARHAVVLR